MPFDYPPVSDAERLIAHMPPDFFPKARCGWDTYTRAVTPRCGVWYRCQERKDSGGSSSLVVVRRSLSRHLCLPASPTGCIPDHCPQGACPADILAVERPNAYATRWPDRAMAIFKAGVDWPPQKAGGVSPHGPRAHGQKLPLAALGKPFEPKQDNAAFESKAPPFSG